MFAVLLPLLGEADEQSATNLLGLPDGVLELSPLVCNLDCVQVHRVQNELLSVLKHVDVINDLGFQGFGGEIRVELDGVLLNEEVVRVGEGASVFRAVDTFLH